MAGAMESRTRSTERFWRASCSGLAPRLVVMLCLVATMLVALPAEPAAAWKMQTHVYSANLVLDMLYVDPATGQSTVTIPPYGDFVVPEEYSTAIHNYPDAFRAGAIGPDGYPDIYIGQAFIHPEPGSSDSPYAGDWLQQQWTRVQAMEDGAHKEEALAFVLGMQVHAAGDMFGHHYVNSYALGVFPAVADLVEVENARIAARHIIIETYIDQVIPLDYWYEWVETDAGLIRVIRGGRLSVHAPVDGPHSFVLESMMTNGGIETGPNVLLESYDALPMHLDAFFELRGNLRYEIARLRTRIAESSWEDTLQVLVWKAALAYCEAWLDDLDAGIEEWPEANDEVAQAMLRSDYDEAEQVLLDWGILHFLSMSGLPDAVGGGIDWVLDVIEDIKPYVEDLIPYQLERLIDEVKDGFLNFMCEEAFGCTYEELKSLNTDPARWINGTNTLDGAGLFDPDYGYPDIDVLVALNARMNVHNVTYPNGDTLPTMTWQEFPELYDTVTMGKLVVIGPDGVNELLTRAGSDVRVGSDAPFWFIRSLDGSNLWDDGRMLDTGRVTAHPLRDDPAVWHSLFKSVDAGLRNGGFEEPSDGTFAPPFKTDDVPIHWDAFNVVGRIECDSDWVHSGEHSLRMTGSDKPLRYEGLFATEDVWASTSFVAEGLRTYRALVYARSDRDPGTVVLNLEFHNAEGDTLAEGSTRGSDWGVNALDMRPMSVDVKAPPGTSYGVVKLEVASDAWSIGKDVAFDDAQVEVIIAEPTFDPPARGFFEPDSVRINGVGEIRYTTDGTEPDHGSTYYTPGTCIPIYHTTTLRARAYSAELGIWSDIHTEAYVVAPPPETSMGVLAVVGDNGWFTSGAQVTLTATDHSGTGILKSGYVPPGGTWTRYTGTFAYTAEGVTTVSYQSADNRDVWETPQSRTFKIDTIEPVSLASTQPVYENGECNVRVVIADSGSGAQMLHYIVDDDGIEREVSANTALGHAYVPVDGIGMHAIEYWAEDGAGNVETARHVSPTFEIVNGPPTARRDEYTTPVSTTLTVPALGVLRNDSDYEGDPLTAAIASEPSHGSVTLATDGGFTYVPDTGYGGYDEFTYTAHDGTDPSDPATVRILVHNPPVANDDGVPDPYTVPVDGVLEVPAPGILANDVISPGAAVDRLEAERGTYTKSVDVHADDGSFVYVPVEGYVGLDSFTYRVWDTFGFRSSWATVHVRVEPNTPVGTDVRVDGPEMMTEHEDDVWEASVIYSTVTAAGVTSFEPLERTPSVPEGVSFLRNDGDYALQVTTTATHSGAITVEVRYLSSLIGIAEEEALNLWYWETSSSTPVKITTEVHPETDTVVGSVDALGIFAIGYSAADMPEDTIYVSKSGSDTLNDGTYSKPYLTVTKAMSVAAYGDRVLVMPGTYRESASVGLKSGVHLMGSGRDGTVIEGTVRFGSVVHATGVDESAMLSGFTLNGATKTSTALLVTDADPRVWDCVVTGSTSGSQGGGVSVSGQSSAAVMDCIISGNEVSGSGGGVCAYDGATLRMEECDITLNTAANRGGGVYCESATLILSDCDVAANSAAAGGGIAFLTAQPSEVLGGRISENAASGDGGGIYVSGSAPVISNVVVSENTAVRGGGIFCSDSPAVVVNDTIVSNQAAIMGDVGDGLECTGPDLPVVFNCVFSNRYDIQGCEVHYCRLSSEQVDEGTHNLSVDPMFVDYGDYRLRPGSRVVDAGTGEYGGVAVWPTDALGTPRTQGAAPDMGAYERTPNTPAGVSVVVTPIGGGTVMFDHVTQPGETWALPDAGQNYLEWKPFEWLDGYCDLTSTASSEGSITVELAYNEDHIPSGRAESGLKMWQREAGSPDAWTPITASVDTTANIVTGVTDHLSWFAIGYNDAPVPDAGGSYEAVEGLALEVDGSASSDENGDSLTYAWDVDGDGLWDSFDSTATARWAEDGTATVTLLVSDGSLTSTGTATISVLNHAPSVEASASLNTTEGHTLVFQGSFCDFGVEDSHAATLDWGDGNSSEATISVSGYLGTVSDTHIYVDEGEYTITLSVLDDDGAVGSDTTTVSVANAGALLDPVLSQTAVPLTQSVGAAAAVTTVELSASFADPGVFDDHWATWYWGDGTNSPGLVVETGGPGTVYGEHEYDSPGVYDVRVELFDADGSKSTGELVLDCVAPVLQNVSVVPAAASCGATITVNGTASSAEGGGASPIAVIEFSQDSGVTWTALEPVDGAYDTPHEVASKDTPLDSDGTHELRVRATDAAGNTCEDVVGINTAPEALSDFYCTRADQPLVVSAPGILGEDVDRDGDALVVVSSTAPVSGGSVVVAVNGSFVYTPLPGWVGNDSFSYTVDDAHGGQSSTDVTVTVSSHVPVADAGAPYEAYEGASVQLDGRGSSDAASDIVLHAWLYSEYEIEHSIGATPTLEFVDDGAVDAVLWVFDADGCYDQDDFILEVANVAPTISPIVLSDQTPVVGQPVDASANFSDPGVLDTHSVLWNWGDGSVTAGTIAETDGAGAAAGSHTYAFSGTFTVTCSIADEDGGTSTRGTAITVEAGTPPPVSFVPVAGSDRFDTAVEASKRAYPIGASTVVIATGFNWPDALGGAALAGVVDGPLLLVRTDSLPPVVAAEIARLGATDAYILGGLSAVSQGVEDEIDSVISGDVLRLAGGDRYGTAGLVADEVITLQAATYSGRAFVATGNNFPDALAASPLAAAAGDPILLVRSDGVPYLPTAVDTAVILGSTSAVTDATEARVRTALGTANVTRVGGADRYDTAGMVADLGVTRGMYWDGVGIATGAAFPDALSGGAMLGRMNSVVLLTRPDVLSSSAGTRLTSNADTIGTVHFLGGTAAVTQAVRDEVAQLLQ